MLELEDVLVNVILKFLIGVVDAQLLKAVCLEVLESKHIQDTDGQTLQTKRQPGKFITKNTKFALAHVLTLW